jgi:hypothetical protein
MNIKKLTIATLASFVTMFIIAGVTHVVIFKTWFLNHPGMEANINRADPMMQYAIIAGLIVAFVMSYLYPKGVEGKSKIMQGLKFGIMVSILLFSCPLIQYAFTTTLSRSAILMDGVLHAAEQGLGGVVIALVYGNAPFEEKMKKAS